MSEEKENRIKSRETLVKSIMSKHPSYDKEVLNKTIISLEDLTNVVITSLNGYLCSLSEEEMTYILSEKSSYRISQTMDICMHAIGPLEDAVLDWLIKIGAIMEEIEQLRAGTVMVAKSEEVLGMAKKRKEVLG